MHIEFYSLLGELANQTPSIVRNYWGKHITFGFGFPGDKIDWTQARGWVLRFEECEWRIDFPDGTSCNCDEEPDSPAAIRSEQWPWCAVQQLAIIGDRLDLRITFTCGAVLTAMVDPDDNGLVVEWQLMNPLGTRAIVYAGGSWTLHYLNKETPDLYWHPASTGFFLEYAECSPRPQ